MDEPEQSFLNDKYLKEPEMSYQQQEDSFANHDRSEQLATSHFTQSQLNKKYSGYNPSKSVKVLSKSYRKVSPSKLT